MQASADHFFPLFYLPSSSHVLMPHPYDHVMAWTSLWILYPVVRESEWNSEWAFLDCLMAVFSMVSLQHWRNHAVCWLHVLDVVCAHVVFAWHLLIAHRHLEEAEWLVCVSYATRSAICFLGNELVLGCRGRALACGHSWSMLHLIPHSLFRYYAFAMVMTSRGKSWTWRFDGAYIGSVCLFALG